MQRFYTPIAFKIDTFEPHYNPSIGRSVSNRREFNDRLKLLSEQDSQKLGGMGVNYQPIDPHDAKVFARNPDNPVQSDIDTAAKQQKIKAKIKSGYATKETSRNPVNKLKLKDQRGRHSD